MSTYVLYNYTKLQAKMPVYNSDFLNTTVLLLFNICNRTKNKFVTKCLLKYIFKNLNLLYV